MKKSFILLLSCAFFTNHLTAATQYIDFHFLNKLNKPVILTWGFKKQGIASIPTEIPAKAEKTDTQLPNEQPIIEFYLKDAPEKKYRYEFMTEGKNKIFVRVVQDGNTIKLEPQTSFLRAMKDNVSQNEIKLLQATTLPVSTNYSKLLQ